MKHLFLRVIQSSLLFVLLAAGAAFISPNSVIAQGPGTVSCPDGSTSTGAICPTLDLSSIGSNVTLSVTASPTTIQSGQSATLSWSSTGAITCDSSDFVMPYDSYVVEGNTYNVNKTSGSVSVSPTATKTYSITCHGLGVEFQGSTETRSATITVTEAPSQPSTPSTPTTPTNDPTATGFSNIFQIDNDTNHASVYATVQVETADLAAGASASISTPYAFPYAGTWHVRACGDLPPYDNGVVVESDGTNNCTSWQTLTITDPAAVSSDLTAGNVTQGTHAGTPYVIRGTPMTFSATATNGGTGSASNFANSFFIQAGGAFAANALSLIAGQSGALSGSYTFGSTGTYNINACADKNTLGAGTVTETSEINNCSLAWTPISVVPTAPTSPTATCNAQGTSATLSWTAPIGATGYYVRANKVGSCPSGWVQPAWDANSCTPSPDWVTGTSIAFPVATGASHNFWVHGAIANGAYGPSSGAGFTCTSSLPQCSNGVDDDGDGYADYPTDPGCPSPDGPEGPNPAIITSFSANPVEISLGQTSTLSWTSTGATSCTVGGFPAGGANSSRSVTPTVVGDNSYSLTCTGAGGTSPESYTPVEVVTPMVSIEALPDTVDTSGVGGSTTLTWSATELTSCSIASTQGPNLVTNQPITSGQVYETEATGIELQTTYTLTCTGPVGTYSDSVLVSPFPALEEF